jgi:EpsI family protein
MIARRDLIFLTASAAAAGAAYQLKPKRRLSLLANRKMDAVIPASFNNWDGQGDVDLVQPLSEGGLAARLYSQSVARIYSNRQTGAEVMMLVAYGENQSDLLQLHRPESCYPAVGFELEMTRRAAIPLGPDMTLPGRHVIASRSDRREYIAYWTRLGEFLPIDASDQQRARLTTAVHGYVADGALFRFSLLGDDDMRAFAVLDQFVAQLVRAVKPAERPALVGTKLSRSLAA